MDGLENVSVSLFERKRKTRDEGGRERMRNWTLILILTGFLCCGLLTVNIVPSPFLMVDALSTPSAASVKSNTKQHRCGSSPCARGLVMTSSTGPSSVASLRGIRGLTPFRSPIARHIGSGGVGLGTGIGSRLPLVIMPPSESISGFGQAGRVESRTGSTTALSMSLLSAAPYLPNNPDMVESTDLNHVGEDFMVPARRMGTPLQPHPQLIEGRLPNGLIYKILPNANPKGRFEAHLEILSGSAMELENQRGMAHLLEHVLYMGSPKRQRIMGTGSKTNAYTDFHHTVFFASCPTTFPHTPGQSPVTTSGGWFRQTSSTAGQPMLPFAFDALLDVLTTKIDPSRLKLERAAVLSEATMVNKMDYRVECQILGTLHRENRMSRRFPIGLESLIQKWTPDDLKYFHDLHYRPDNAIIYLVGDLDFSGAQDDDGELGTRDGGDGSWGEAGGEQGIEYAVQTIFEKFSALKPRIDGNRLLQESGEFERVTVRDINRHFPAILHDWYCDEEKVLKPLLPAKLMEIHAKKRQRERNEREGRDLGRKRVKDEIMRAKQRQIAAPGTQEMESTAVHDVVTSSAKGGISTEQQFEIQRIKEEALLPASTVFHHELLQSFSFHLFSKKPIDAMTTVESFKRELFRRIVLNTLTVRLNVQSRHGSGDGGEVVSTSRTPPFTYAEFHQVNWPREGCSVCSLDVTADPTKWRDAVATVVREIRRLGLYGLTPGEWTRYRQTALSDAIQAAIHSESSASTNEQLLQEIMDSEQNGHTLTHPMYRYEITQQILSEDSSILLNEVNDIAKELCGHLSHLVPGEIQPSAIVTCSPSMNPSSALSPSTLTSQLPSPVSEDAVAQVIAEVLLEELTPVQDTPVPPTLLPDELIQNRLEKAKVDWVESTGESDIESVKPLLSPTASNSLPVKVKQLSNGIKVNIMQFNEEPQSVGVRAVIRGGRWKENKSDGEGQGIRPGAVALGVRAMQEGGACLNLTREEVELFCIDHMVMVELNANEDGLVFDLQGPISAPGHHPGVQSEQAISSTASSTDEHRPITGVEAVMQVLHILLSTGTSVGPRESEGETEGEGNIFIFEQDAFERAKQGLHEQHESIVKGLETRCSESLTHSLTRGDKRLLSPSHTDVDKLSFQECIHAVRDQIAQRNEIEISICGDMPIEDMEGLVMKYLGSLPSVGKSVSSSSTDSVSASTPLSLPLYPLGREKQLSVHLPDSEVRAMAYLAGPAPNTWGYFSDGETITQKILALTSSSNTAPTGPLNPLKQFLRNPAGVLSSVSGGGSNKESEDVIRRSHPLFGAVSQLIVQEVSIFC